MDVEGGGWAFAPDTDNEEKIEEENDDWKDVERGEAAPETPRMSPVEGGKKLQKGKGLSQGTGEDEELFGTKEDEKWFKELFMDKEEKNKEEGWKRWKELFDDEDAEEGRRPQKAQSCPKASKEEREEHDLTHCPMRIWCRYCVEGRCHKMGHVRKKDEDKNIDGVPRISMDYFFMSQKDEKANEFPMLVAVDESTGDKFARATGRKGVVGCDWLIKEFSEELKTWGHAGGSGGKIILKCDGENALKAFRNALAKYHGGINHPRGTG